MRAHPKLTEAQITKAVKMSEDAAVTNFAARNYQWNHDRDAFSVDS